MPMLGRSVSYPHASISLLLPKEDKGAFPLPECFAEQYGSVVPGERGGIRIQGFEDSVPLEAE